MENQVTAPRILGSGRIGTVVVRDGSQPAESRTYRTPDFGRLHRLEDDERERRPDELLERVLALQSHEQPPKLKPGVKPTAVPEKTKRRVAELRIAGSTVAGIMDDTGLTKTIATRLVRDVDDALGTLRAGRY